MSINNEAGTARQFVAARQVFSTSWIKGTKIWQAVYTVVFVGFVGFAVLMMYNTSRGAKTPHLPRYTGLYFIAGCWAWARSSASTRSGGRDRSTCLP